MDLLPGRPPAVRPRRRRPLFFHLAVVPDQTVSSASFEVQVIAENIDPGIQPNSAFSPDRVRIHNLDVKSVLHVQAPASNSRTFDYRSVADTADISSRLNAIATLSGAVFSNVRIAPAP